MLDKKRQENTMKKTKLIEIVATFDIEALENLKVFGQMPYLGLKPEEVNILILIIDKFKAKGNNIEEQTRKALSKKGLNIKNNQWNTIKNRLLQVVYEFLALKLISNTHNSRLALISYFIQHKAGKNLNYFLQKTEKIILEAPQNLSIDYYKFRLNELKLIQKQPLIEKMEELEQMDSDLDRFYLVNKLKLLTEMYNRRNIMNDDVTGLEDITSKLVSAFDLDNSNEIIQVSNALLLLIKHKTHTDYIAVKNLIEQHEGLLADDFIEDVFTYLLNFCANASNRGEEIYASEYVGVIKKLVEKKWLIKNSYLSQGKYVNTITCAIAIGEIEWLRSFVETFSKYLKEGEEDVINMIYQVHIELYAGDILKAKEVLLKIRTQDPYMKIKCKKLLLQIHYEEGITEIIDNELEAIRQFVYRSKVLSKQKRDTALNFVKIMAALVNEGDIDLKEFEGKILLLDMVWLSKHIGMK